MASNITEQTAIEEIGPGQFRSKFNPGRMGNAKPIAYGGCTLGVATRAAYTGVPPTHHLYSLVGHYHGPASTTEKLVCTVHSTRTTKSFTTRRVVVQQAQPITTTAGSAGAGPQQMQMRTCMELIADFHAEEPAAPHMTYSAAPSRPYAASASQSETPVVLESILSAEEQATVERSREVFALNERFVQTRPCREGVAAQNLNGLLRARPTTQDALPLTDRTSAEWLRNKEPDLASPADQAAALAFCLDGGLSFLPLSLDHGWLEDVSACSSLDFALRLMEPRPDFNRWHLRERKTIAGGAGRTYSEGRMWDEEGNLIAIMSQQSIMRPKPEKGPQKEKSSRL
ncbi:uncharacterized protein PG998_008039 [Apiospora kogelbergensis]|uniref:uncharacterized protein n=1 Tax=Apiospora kogelbergensis TaxID=1337665 RepID=UPI00312F8AC2